ncbi:unnamed protein product [Cunninghamella blakesleeana]
MKYFIIFLVLLCNFSITVICTCQCSSNDRLCIDNCVQQTEECILLCEDENEDNDDEDDDFDEDDFDGCFNDCLYNNIPEVSYFLDNNKLLETNSTSSGFFDNNNNNNINNQFDSKNVSSRLYEEFLNDQNKSSNIPSVTTTFITITSYFTASPSISNHNQPTGTVENMTSLASINSINISLILV